MWIEGWITLFKRLGRWLKRELTPSPGQCFWIDAFKLFWYAYRSGPAPTGYSQPMGIIDIEYGVPSGIQYKQLEHIDEIEKAMK